jgi:uncharacterized protein (TIGR03083 family)
VNLDELYLDCHQRFVGLVTTLDNDQLASNVPCCPAWSVRDLTAHVTSVALRSVEEAHPLQQGDEIDFEIKGNDRARIIDDLTEHAVRARRGRSLDDILAEWHTALPRALDVLAGRAPLPTGSAEAVKYAVVGDLAIHLQDARGALNLPGDRTIPAAQFAFESWVLLLQRRVAANGLPAITIIDRTIGEGEAAAAIDADWYEVLRGLSGRRSEHQLRSMFIRGDPEPYLPVLTTFQPPATDITE